MMKFKSIVMIVIVFAMISFTMIVNAQTNHKQTTNHNPINSETTSSSEDTGIYSGSDDPGVIHSETVNGMFAIMGTLLANHCINNGRPGWIDITADSRFQAEFMKQCKIISKYVVDMRKKGVSFEKIVLGDEMQNLIRIMGRECGKVFKSIWVQREKRGWRIY
jgi:hypothetical protein